MDSRDDIREFLASRRARLTPEMAGLPNYGGSRRVPGLRRAEVALLAGVSPDYYVRLERGNLSGVSDNVLEAIARALRLDEAERSHLYDLARAANHAPRTRRATRQQVRPAIQQLLDAMTDAPAFVRNGRLDILAVNALGRALYAPAFDTAARPVNLARFCFLDPRAAELYYPDWDEAANTTVALLRTEAGRDPYDKMLSDLVGELATRSDDFRRRWAAHEVRLHHTGVKHFHHPNIGRIDVAFEAMPMPADPGLTLTAYSAEPGTASWDALRLLASLSATAEEVPLVGGRRLPGRRRPGGEQA